MKFKKLLCLTVILILMLPLAQAIFTQPDSQISDVYDPQSLNRYMFERGNPYKYTDPTGHMGEGGPADLVDFFTLMLAAIFLPESEEEVKRKREEKTEYEELYKEYQRENPDAHHDAYIGLLHAGGEVSSSRRISLSELREWKAEKSSSTPMAPPQAQPDQANPQKDAGSSTPKTSSSGSSTSSGGGGWLNQIWDWLTGGGDDGDDGSSSSSGGGSSSSSSSSGGGSSGDDTPWYCGWWC